MKKSDQFKLERTTKMEAQRTIVSLAKTEKREMTTEENTSFDSLQDDIDALDANVTRAEKFEANELRLAANPVHRIAGEGDDLKPKIQKRYSVARHLLLAFEGKPLDGAELEMNNRAIAESRAAGLAIDETATVHIPMSVLRGTGQSVSEDAGAYGGALVQDQAARYQPAFSPRLFLEELGATMLTGLEGGDVPLPVAGGAVFQWLGETEEISDSKVGIAGPVLSPKRLGAAIPVSRRLLMQSSIDAEKMVMDILRKGFENAVQLAAINGSGTANQPRGILNTVGVFNASHAAGPATRAMTLALQGEVESADSTDNSLGFLIHPRVKYSLMGTPIDAGSGRFLLENNTVNGEKAVSSSLVPSLTGQRPVIYGDWSQLFIGVWGSLSLVVNPWTKLKAGQLEIVANAYADVQIAQPTAFAVDKFITTV